MMELKLISILILDFTPIKDFMGTKARQYNCETSEQLITTIEASSLMPSLVLSVP